MDKVHDVNNIKDESWKEKEENGKRKKMKLEWSNTALVSTGHFDAAIHFRYFFI